MAYAVIRTGGKQFKVSSGDTLEVELISGAPAGSQAEFNDVLLVSDGSNVKIGQPLVSGAKVTGTVLEEFKAPKVVSFKYVSKQGYHRTRGHRQRLARVKINEIVS